MFGSEVLRTLRHSFLCVFSHAYSKLQEDHVATQQSGVFVDSAERCICVLQGMWHSSIREVFTKVRVWWGTSEGCQIWGTLDKTEHTECCLEAATCNSIPSFSLSEEILVSLQKRAVVRPLCVVHFGSQFVSSYKSSCVLTNNITL